MSSYVWFRISTKMALIIDENAAIFGLKASLLCHVLSLSQLFVHLLVSWQWKYCWPNWWRFSGIYQTWRRSMTFHDNPCLINFAHFCKCLSFICWVELNFSQKKTKTWGFCPPWPNVELILMMVFRPLAQSERGEWVCLPAAADVNLCPFCYLVEVYLGRVLNVLYWKVAWLIQFTHPGRDVPMDFPCWSQPWVFSGDSTRHRGIRKRPSKHTGRSARSRKVDPTC